MFGYRVQKDLKLSLVIYFNQRLLRYSQEFAAESYYIFFAQNILQNVVLQQQINFAMRKVIEALNTFSFKSVNFKEKVTDSVVL